MPTPYNGNASNFVPGLPVGTGTGIVTDGNPVNAGETDPAPKALADGLAFAMQLLASVPFSQWSSPITSSSSVVAVATRTDTFNDQVSGTVRAVFIGSGGAFYSSDYAVWAHSGTSPSSVNGIAWGNSVWVAVGGTGASAGSVYTSTDGKTWTNPTSSLSNTLIGIYYSANLSLWIAVGLGGIVYTSNNPTSGASWTSRTSNTTQNLTDIGAGPGNLLIAYPAGATTKNYITSPDGLTWTQRSLPGGASSTFGNGWYSPGSFLVVDNGGIVWQSTDGINWTNNTSLPAGDHFGFRHSITFNGSSWITISLAGRVWTSADALHWGSRVIPDVIQASLGGPNCLGADLGTGVTLLGALNASTQSIYYSLGAIVP